MIIIIISTRRPDPIIIKEKEKKTCKIVDFAVPENKTERM